MTLKEILDQSKNLEIFEKRDITDKYAELVFLTRDAEKWEQFLSGVLGPAVKVTGNKPEKEDLNLTKTYGGIRIGQSLFKKKFDKITVIAMLWPWQDKNHTTLKLALLRG